MGNRLVENAVEMKKGLKKFLKWLYGLLDNNDNIVLVAHNCFKFDAVILQKNLKKFGLQELPENISFADTMDLMNCLKDQGLLSGRSIALQTLLKIFGTESFNQHDAWSDTVNLIKVARI